MCAGNSGGRGRDDECRGEGRGRGCGRGGVVANGNSQGRPFGGNPVWVALSVGKVSMVWEAAAGPRPPRSSGRRVPGGPDPIDSAKVRIVRIPGPLGASQPAVQPPNQETARSTPQRPERTPPHPSLGQVDASDVFGCDFLCRACRCHRRFASGGSGKPVSDCGLFPSEHSSLLLYRYDTLRLGGP